MSILEVNLPTMSLVGSVTATSYVLFSHIGLSQYGPIPLLRGTLAPDVQLRPSDKVKAWAAFYEAGKVKWCWNALTAESDTRRNSSQRDLLRHHRLYPPVQPDLQDSSRVCSSWLDDCAIHLIRHHAHQQGAHGYRREHKR